MGKLEWLGCVKKWRHTGTKGEVAQKEVPNLLHPPQEQMMAICSAKLALSAIEASPLLPSPGSFFSIHVGRTLGLALPTCPQLPLTGRSQEEHLVVATAQHPCLRLSSQHSHRFYIYGSSIGRHTDAHMHMHVHVHARTYTRWFPGRAM